MRLRDKTQMLSRENLNCVALVAFLVLFGGCASFQGTSSPQSVVSSPLSEATSTQVSASQVPSAPAAPVLNASPSSGENATANPTRISESQSKLNASTAMGEISSSHSRHSEHSYEQGASEASRLHVQEEAVKKLCKEIAALYKRNAWGRVDPCLEFNFKVFGWSEQKRPLVYYEAGNAEATKLTLIQCGIHGDELPTLPMCLRLIAEIREGKRKIPSKTRIWIQPLLNPDGMLAAKPTRTNANGVDINRNFPTKDWSEKALSLWKSKEKESERKYPGQEPLSQSETRAIVDVIESFRPQKIISIHTPLGFLDLDAQGGPDIKRRAKFLAINMSKNSGNYKFLSFGFYPGSLGNYAGQERHIPVYTLELPPGDNRATVDSYWKKFRLALWRAIDFDLETGQFQED